MTHLAVAFVGHLDVLQVQDELRAIESDIEANGTVALLIDASRMTGYETAARQAFVAWNRENRDRVTTVAVVTDKPLWHMVVRAMSLASAQSMRPFHTRAEAETWLRTT